MSGPLDPLSDRAVELLDSVSPWEQDDPSVIAVMRGAADELDGIYDLMETVRTQAWPHLADDTYGLLSIHEKMLGLPANPAGATLAQRRAATKAAVQSRRVGSKANWILRMNSAMRGHQWSYQENFPGPGQLTIKIPYNAGTYSAQQVEALADRITPAHLEIIMGYSDGFIVGVSRIGEDAI